MPKISPDLNPLDKYGLLGNSLSEMITNFFNNPKNVFSLLFYSPLKEGFTVGIKAELYLMVLVSGGYALIYRPYYLVMLIPIFAQKLLATNYVLWGINGQYSIEFVPILSLCLADLLTRIKIPYIVYAIATSATLVTIFFTFKKTENRTSVWYEYNKTAFYSKLHYQTPIHVREIYKVLSSVPTIAAISVNAPLAPHLAFRDKIYHFPVIKDATYIILYYLINL